MKKFTNLFKFKAIALFALLFFVSTQVEATHFRYGTLSWEITSYNATSRTVQFSITQSWRWSFFGNPPVGATVNNVGTFNFGDGATTTLSLVVTSVNAAENWFVGTRTLTKVYNRTTDVLALFQGCCRISTLQQNNNDKNYRLETVVTLSNPGNRAPVGSTLPIFYVQTGLPNAQIQLNATDPDNDPINFAISSSAQSGLVTTTPAIFTSLSTSGLLSLNTTAAAIGRQYAMQVMVSDNQGARVPLDFIIQVVGVSNPPIFDYTVTPLNGSTIKVQPGVPINFPVRAYDVDPGSTVALNASGIPIGATLSSQVGTNPAQVNFSWIPTNANLGTYALSFSATDNIFVQSITNVNIVVSLAPVFDVPPTPAIGVHNVVAPGDNLTFTVQATDPDPLDVCAITEVNGKDMMTNSKIPIYAGVTMTPALPTASSNTASSVFSWTPTAAQWGHKHAIFTAQDSYGDKTDHEVSILVNTNPLFTSTPVTSVIATQNYQYNITSTDPDVLFGDVLSLHSANVLPAWLTLTDNGDGTGTLSGTPGLADAGTYNISLVVHDINHHTNVGGIPTQTFTIEVIPCLIEISGNISDVLCLGDNSGAIDITLSGIYGTPSFAWTGPDGYTAITEDISGLAAGTYNVIVSSNLGCSETQTFAVETTPDETLPTAVAQNLTVQLDANGNASITVNGTYSVGSVAGTLPTQNSASIVTSQSCNCPTGYVAVGYEGFAGCITDNFRLICKELNPDGTLGAAIAVTCFSGGGVTIPFTTSLTGDQILVGFNVTDVDYLYAGTRIHIGVQGIGKSLAEIAGNSANNTNNTSLPGLNGWGCFSSNYATTTQFAPDGHVIVGMEVNPNGYSSAVKFNYAPISYVAGLNNGSNDNCGIASIIASKTQFTCADLGDNTVTLTVTDLSGNSASTTATVTVQDNIAPTVNNPPNIVVYSDADLCGAVVCYPAPVASDNCRPATPAGYNFLNSYGNSYYYQSNVLSNYATAVAKAAAAGGHLAVITSAAENAAIAAGGGTFSYIGGNDVVKEGAFVWSNCETFSYSNFAGGEPNGGIGENYLEFMGGGFWNDISGNNPRYAILEIEGASVVQTAGLPANSVFPIGTTTNTFVITDAAGNTATCSFDVTVIDNQAPAINCAYDIVVDNDSGVCGAVVIYNVSSSDNCPGQTVEQTAGQPSGSVFPVGTTTNTFVVTDASGNTATCSFDVTVNNTLPEVTIVSGPATPVALGNSISLSISHNDNNLTNATIDWDDLTPIENVTNPSTGSFDVSHTYATPGVYTVSVTLTDACGEVSATYLYQYVVIYDPNGGFVTGGGWFWSEACAYKDAEGVSGRANFGFVAKYKRGSTVPDGNTEFQFKAGNLNFHSSQYDDMRLVIAGARANYKGVGYIKGSDHLYGFMVSAIDGNVSGGGGTDKFRIKIWDKDDNDRIVYDNNCTETDENSDPATAIGGGSIVIHEVNGKKSAEFEIQMGDVAETSVKAYPNPFSARVFFDIQFANDANALLEIFDIRGAKLGTLLNHRVEAGQQYRFEYTPVDVAPGVLMYRLVVDGEVMNGRILYQKQR
jgi:hypothetical protein